MLWKQNSLNFVLLGDRYWKMLYTSVQQNWRKSFDDTVHVSSCPVYFVSEFYFHNS